MVPVVLIITQPDRTRNERKQRDNNSMNTTTNTARKKDTWHLAWLHPTGSGRVLLRRMVKEKKSSYKRCTSSTLIADEENQWARAVGDDDSLGAHEPAGEGSWAGTAARALRGVRPRSSSSRSRQARLWSRRAQAQEPHVVLMVELVG